jgi:predicted XRE-type DNA-binding protein
MSRNPFLDLGFSPEEATALHIRSQLAATLESYITRKGWSQAEAAKTFKVPQPTISKIVNGNIEKLSIEFLVKLAVRVGLPVNVSAGRAARITTRRSSERAAA